MPPPQQPSHGDDPGPAGVPAADITAADPRGRDVWRTSFGVPARAVEAFWSSGLADACLSISAFEEDGAAGDGTASDGAEGGGADGGGGPWRIELLHAGPPDRPALERGLAALAAACGLAPIAPAVEPVPAADWVAEVARRFPPTRVGRFLVHAGQREGGGGADPTPVGAVPIRIDPGRAFGSGEHATTRGCLLALDGLARARRFRRVLDLGCGSGVLAIAAAKAWPVLHAVAADSDPVAAVVAAENAALNGVAGRVRVLVSEGYAHPAIAALGPYDLVLANILADPLRALARDLARHLAPGGVAVLSGLLDRQADAVARAHRPYGLALRRTIAVGPWATLVLARSRAAARRYEEGGAGLARRRRRR